MTEKAFCSPYFEPIDYQPLDSLIACFSDKNDLMVLGSTLTSTENGRYSFICFDAFNTFVGEGRCFFWENTLLSINDPFLFIQEKLSEYAVQKAESLPPFQGGAVGYFSYEASHYLESLPSLSDEIGLPQIYLNFYSHTIAIDHLTQQSWIIATGFPEKEPSQRKQKAYDAISSIKQSLSHGKQYSRKDNNGNSNNNDNNDNATNARFRKTVPHLSSNFTQATYVTAVEGVKQRILAGDIFEANLSQQFQSPLPDLPAFMLYRKLMAINPAPYSAFFKVSDLGYLVSSSPEQFIKLSDKNVSTCPIKGTCKRIKEDPHEDAIAAQTLVESEKDRSENIMIVDLMRNDLSKVCIPGSVNVEKLCYLETLPTVHHLVSKITGELQDHQKAMDLIKATFPPGSVTGAPKIRAMEIISEFEKIGRGPYCGTMGYFSFTGDIHTAVTIRTFTLNSEKIFFSAGGAIVLDSNPHDEYLESLAKAQALIKTLSLDPIT